MNSETMANLNNIVIVLANQCKLQHIVLEKSLSTKYNFCVL